MTSSMAATSQSQLWCFSTVHRSLHLRSHSLPYLSLRSSKEALKYIHYTGVRSYPRQYILTETLSVAMSLERHGADTAGSDTRSTLSYEADESKLHVEENQMSYPTKEEHSTEKIGLAEATQEDAGQQKKTAKIHDFCLGIPFGGYVITGGIIGFLLSRSPVTLASGVLFGGALLVLSTLSLKVWRQGKSSLPFILGQAALSGILIWKNFQSYSLAKKIFPTGISTIISSAMLCFYLYVLISGGNPPPKKLKPSASIA